MEQSLSQQNIPDQKIKNYVNAMKKKVNRQQLENSTWPCVSKYTIDEMMSQSDTVTQECFAKWATEYYTKNQNLIDRMEGVPDEKRTARFVCAIAAVFPDGREYVVRGTIEGRIGYEEKGENGFGYDPIFFLPDRGLTTAQLSPEEKNSISHRGNALRKMKELLEKEKIL